MLLLAGTGILINHTDELKLSQRFVSSVPLLDWYGIRTAQPAESFETGGHWISRIGERLYLDGTPLSFQGGPLRGAVSTGRHLTLALPDKLVLLSAAGEVIEEIELHEILRSDIERIGVGTAGEVFVQSDGKVYFSDDDLLSWKKTESPALHWAERKPLPADLAAALSHSHRSNVLSLERLLLDLHSGRFFGRAGVFIVDAASLCFVFLGLSGVWIWLKRKLALHRGTRARARRKDSDAGV